MTEDKIKEILDEMKRQGVEGSTKQGTRCLTLSLEELKLGLEVLDGEARKDERTKAEKTMRKFQEMIDEKNDKEHLPHQVCSHCHNIGRKEFTDEVIEKIDKLDRGDTNYFYFHKRVMEYIDKLKVKP